MKITIAVTLVSLALGAAAAEPAGGAKRKDAASTEKKGKPLPPEAFTGPNSKHAAPNPDLPKPLPPETWTGPGKNLTNPNPPPKGLPAEAFVGPNPAVLQGKQPRKPGADGLGPHPELPAPPGFSRSDEVDPYAPQPNKPPDPAFKRSDDPRGPKKP